MPLDCPGARDDIDASAIGALDADEARALEAHLSSCAACARLAHDALESATAAMSLSVPLISSSPALKARVMASAAVLRELRVQAGPRFGWWHAGAAALIAAICGVFAWALVMQLRVDRLDQRNATLRLDATAQSRDLATVRSDLRRAADLSASLAGTVATQNQIVDLMTEPDVRRTPMQGTAAAPTASGHYVWSPVRDAGALVAAGLPQLTTGQVYEMWVVYADKRWTSAGTFSPDASGTARLIVHGTPNDEPQGTMPSWFCVTVEPAEAPGGAAGTMVLRSTAQ